MAYEACGVENGCVRPSRGLENNGSNRLPSLKQGLCVKGHPTERHLKESSQDFASWLWSWVIDSFDLFWGQDVRLVSFIEQFISYD